MVNRKKETSEDREIKSAMSAYIGIVFTVAAVIVMAILDLVFKKNMWDMLFAISFGLTIYYYNLAKAINSDASKKRSTTMFSIMLIASIVTFIFFFVF